MSDTEQTSSVDEPTSDELAAASIIRPLEEMTSPWQVVGTPKLIAAPTLQALSPADQQTVRDQAGSADPDAIQRALTGFLRERQRELRIKCGPGEGATETEIVALDQANRVRLLSDEHSKIRSELSEVSELRIAHDADGKQLPDPVKVFRLKGDARSARERRLSVIENEMALIAGVRGDAELKAAARKEALKRRELRSQIEEAQEVQRVGEEMLRNERIEAKAKSYASFRRSRLT